MGERETNAGLAGLLVLGFGACCGLPLLFSIGLLGAITGIGLGSWLVIGIGLGAVAVGAARWRSRARQCQVPASDEVAKFERRRQ